MGKKAKSPTESCEKCGTTLTNKNKVGFKGKNGMEYLYTCPACKAKFVQ